MKSRTSLFNRTIIVNLLQRYWILFAAYLLVLGAVRVTPLINALQGQGWNNTNVPHYASLIQMMNHLSDLLILNFIAVPVIVTLLFSFLYNTRHTGMMASLPVQRETMYLSVNGAALLGMLLSNLVMGLVMLLVEIIYGQVHIGAICMIVGISLLMILVFLGFAAFCCMLTGNIFAGPAVYLIFNFITVAVELAVDTLLQPVVFGIANNYSAKTMFMSPILMLGNNLNFSYERINNEAGKWVDYTWKLNGVNYLVIYTVVGLVFLWLGMLLYKNRRMETAGDTISIEILKPVFRFCCTVGGGLAAAMFIKELLYGITPTGAWAAAYLAGLLIIGGILGYFISKMLIEKTIAVFRTGWKSVGLYAICVVVLMTCIETDVFGYERKVPHVSEIEAVALYTHDGHTIEFTEEDNIMAVKNLHDDIILNKDLHEMESGSQAAINYLAGHEEPNAQLSKRSLRITYQLEGGKIMTRRYQVTYSPDEIRDPNSQIRRLETLLNTEEAIRERYIADYSVTADNVSGAWVEYTDPNTFENIHFSDFAPSDMARLYNECIVPDILDGKLGVIDIIEDEEYGKSKYSCTVGLEVWEALSDGEYGGRSYKNYKSIVVYPMLESSRTMAFLKEYGIEPPTVYESLTEKGVVFNDLGHYTAYEWDENGVMYELYDKYEAYDSVAVTREVSTSAASIGIIGGADGPTAVYVAK